MSDGAFGWKRRMGVHEAYHTHPLNRWMHWLCIPLELWAVVKLASLASFGSFDLALVLITVLAPIYILAEPLLGSLMVGFLVGCWRLATWLLPESPIVGAVVAVVVFAVTFGLQVAVGHGVFEQGRDDTKANLEELARTKNPIPIVLVFFYHLVEIALAAGYRPALARAIRGHTEREVAAMDAL
jgi:uncharacterized membrane protein YGL010W